jgi:hypothetical protein
MICGSEMTEKIKINFSFSLGSRECSVYSNIGIDPVTLVLGHNSELRNE